MRLAMDSPCAEAAFSVGNTVPRRVARRCDALAADWSSVKSARSWASVSRIRLVMSGVFRRALVKRFGGGKLRGVSTEILYWIEGSYESSEMALAESAICSRWLSRRAIAAYRCCIKLSRVKQDKHAPRQPG